MSHSMTKPTKWPMRPAKTQISLGIRPVWSESLLSTLSAQQRLIRLHGCPDWSDFSLGAQSLCWFCCEAAHIWEKFQTTWKHNTKKAKKGDENDLGTFISFSTILMLQQYLCYNICYDNTYVTTYITTIIMLQHMLQQFLFTTILMLQHMLQQYLCYNNSYLQQYLCYNNTYVTTYVTTILVLQHILQQSLCYNICYNNSYVTTYVTTILIYNNTFVTTYVTTILMLQQYLCYNICYNNSYVTTYVTTILMLQQYLCYNNSYVTTYVITILMLQQFLCYNICYNNSYVTTILMLYQNHELHWKLCAWCAIISSPADIESLTPNGKSGALTQDWVGEWGWQPRQQM